MKYLCLGYFDKEKMDTLSKDEVDSLMGRCKPYIDELYQDSGLLLDAGLETSSTCVRAEQGKITVTDGPFVETKEQVGNAMIIEARDLNDAIRIACMHPAVKMSEASRYGWGIEIRPIWGMEQR